MYLLIDMTSMNRIVLFIVLFGFAVGLYAEKILIRSQEDFDNMPEVIHGFVEKHKNDVRTAELEIEINDGEYVIRNHTIAFPKPTHANVRISIHAKHSGKTIIRSPYDEYSTKDGILIHELKRLPEIMPCMMDDGDDNAVEFCKSGDNTESGVNYVSSKPEIVNEKKLLLRLGIPDDMPYLRNHPLSGDSLSVNPYFKEAFAVLTTQWNRLIVRPLWSDSKYLYIQYVPKCNTLTGDGHFDEAYKKRTRINLYNLQDSYSNDKVLMHDGSIILPQSSKKIRTYYGTSSINIKNLMPRLLKISGICFSGITSKGDFMTIQRCSNVTLSNNVFRNFCTNTFLGYMVSIYGDSSIEANSVNIENNTFQNSNNAFLNLLFCRGCNVRGNRFNLSGTYMSGTQIAIRYCDSTQIVSNVFRNNPCRFISCGNSDERPRSVLIEDNDFGNTELINKRVNELCTIDMGFIYFGATKNLRRTFRNNIIHDVIGYANNRGVFIDDGAHDVTLEGNVISGENLEYSVDARYATHPNVHIDENMPASNNILRNNILFGRVRWQGNKYDPYTSVVYDNFIQLQPDEKPNDFRDAKLEGRIITDSLSRVTGNRVILHSSIPWKMHRNLLKIQN